MLHRLSWRSATSCKLYLSIVSPVCARCLNRLPEPPVQTSGAHPWPGKHANRLHAHAAHPRPRHPCVAHPGENTLSGSKQQRSTASICSLPELGKGKSMTLDTMAGGATVGKAGGGRQQCRELGCDITYLFFTGGLKRVFCVC